MQSRLLRASEALLQHLQTVAWGEPVNYGHELAPQDKQEDLDTLLITVMPWEPARELTMMTRGGHYQDDLSIDIGFRQNSPQNMETKATAFMAWIDTRFALFEKCINNCTPGTELPYTISEGVTTKYMIQRASNRASADRDSLLQKHLWVAALTIMVRTFGVKE
jgi:hypothetical protein